MSSNLINKVLDIFGMGDDIEEINEEEKEEIDVLENEPIEVISNSKKSKVVSIHSAQNSKGSKVVIFQPCEYEEITTVCDCLKNKKIVIINLQKLDSKLAQRFVDFVGGAAYALDGSIQQVSPNIVLLTPFNVEVSSDLRDELTNRGIFSWVSK